MLTVLHLSSHVELKKSRQILSSFSSINLYLFFLHPLAVAIFKAECFYTNKKQTFSLITMSQQLYSKLTKRVLPQRELQWKILENQKIV